MVSARSLRKPFGFALALSFGALVCTTSGNAAANDVSSTGKGIAGGALLGGEVGYLGLAAAGAQQSWLYYTLPPLLAIGGGFGGYYVEQGSSTAEVPLFMLAGGMALVIPTVVITLSATSYRGGSEDSTPADAAPAEAAGSVNVGGGAAGASIGGSGSSTTAPPPAAGPAKHKPSPTSLRLPPPSRSFALVSYDTVGALRVGVPAVGFKPSYSTNELAKFGLAQRYEVHAPIVDVTF